MATAIYPGTFDPPTNGHLDIIERGARLFETLIVAVAERLEKEPLFPVRERVAMLREVCKGIKNVRVVPFRGLLVRFASQQGADTIIKGLRAVSDFESELQMALMNRTLVGGLDTLFLMTRADYLYLSSSIVKEVAGLGGNVTPYVPPAVAKRLAAKLKGRGRSQ
jgi:pantetheine-phosphate adenylyltransferase